MQKYKVTARVAVIPSGVIAISAEQSGPRRHNLKAQGGDRWEILRPVEFKAGEVIGYEGELPKAMADNLELVEAQKRAKARPEADAEKE
ncbi:MAG: hypothetical protein AB7I42_25695 [Bradyrhizobium sp.]|uniref:hypothetical protein n=1 Tax=Bradyrhizobium sp. TaxID=376 RepID=UPI003D0AD304